MYRQLKGFAALLSVLAAHCSVTRVEGLLCFMEIIYFIISSNYYKVIIFQDKADKVTYKKYFFA